MGIGVDRVADRLDTSVAEDEVACSGMGAAKTPDAVVGIAGMGCIRLRRERISTPSIRIGAAPGKRIVIVPLVSPVEVSVRLHVLLAHEVRVRASIAYGPDGHLRLDVGDAVPGRDLAFRFPVEGSGRGDAGRAPAGRAIAALVPAACICGVIDDGALQQLK